MQQTAGVDGFIGVDHGRLRPGYTPAPARWASPERVSSGRSNRDLSAAERGGNLRGVRSSTGIDAYPHCRGRQSLVRPAGPL